jgi:dihydrofolate reductase
MRKVILSMQLTLDGYIEGPNGAMDWMAPAENDQWDEQFEFLKSIDTMLLGRTMYPDYAKYWYATLNNLASNKLERHYASVADNIQHIVFSRTMEQPVTDGIAAKHTRFVRGDAAAEILKLKNQPGKNIVVWGGARLASSLINAGVVDEYHLMVNPIILGGGKTLFKDATEKRKLQLLTTKTFKGGVVALHYKSMQV